MTDQNETDEFKDLLKRSLERETVVCGRLLKVLNSVGPIKNLANLILLVATALSKGAIIIHEEDKEHFDDHTQITTENYWDIVTNHIDFPKIHLTVTANDPNNPQKMQIEEMFTSLSTNINVRRQTSPLSNEIVKQCNICHYEGTPSKMKEHRELGPYAPGHNQHNKASTGQKVLLLALNSYI